MEQKEFFNIKVKDFIKLFDFDNVSEVMLVKKEDWENIHTRRNGERTRLSLQEAGKLYPENLCEYEECEFGDGYSDTGYTTFTKSYLHIRLED